MKNITFLIILMQSLLATAGPVDFVDPRIGTDKTHFISMWRSEAATTCSS